MTLELLWEIVCGYRRLFGVPDEIPDVTRNSGGEDQYIGRRVLESGIVLGVPGDDQRDRKVFRRHRQALGGLMGQGERAHHPTKGLSAPPTPSHIARRGGGATPREAAPPGFGGKFPRGCGRPNPSRVSPVAAAPPLGNPRAPPPPPSPYI